MTVERSRFGLPLLVRELTEIANRRRTYWLRGVYAVLLFLLAYFLCLIFLPNFPAQFS